MNTLTLRSLAKAAGATAMVFALTAGAVNPHPLAQNTVGSAGQLAHKIADGISMDDDPFGGPASDDSPAASPWTDTDEVAPGRAYYVKVGENSGKRCSFGAVVRDRLTGGEGFLTAAHCSLGTRRYQPIEVVDSKEKEFHYAGSFLRSGWTAEQTSFGSGPRESDIAYINQGSRITADPSVAGERKVKGTLSLDELKFISKAQNGRLPLCKWGAHTDESCGVVDWSTLRSTSDEPTSALDGKTTSDHWTVQIAGANIHKGDSGGAVYFPDTDGKGVWLVGIATATPYGEKDGNTVIVTGIDSWLEKWKLEVVPSA